MMTFLRIILGLALIGIVAILAIIFVPAQRTPAQGPVLTSAIAPDDAAYAMRLGDCAGCHTAEGGKPFAGGRPIDSPFGKIYSSNITPDPDAGIGAYTLDDFRAALYDGIDRDGHRLYPAMPSANYRKMTEADIDALYAYFMDSVEPVAEPAQRTDLAFPFDQRWGIRVWQWLAYDDPGFTPSFNDAVLDRGAYLAEGPGHCGACHTPRNAVFVQKAYGDADPDFLTGGTIAGWSVPSLRGPDSASQKWSEADMVAYLRDGRNSESAVVGEMHLVIEESLQYMTDDDLHAIAAYLRRIGGNAADDTTPPLADMPQTDTAAMLTMADPGMALGPRLYLDNCNACHVVNGKGADGVFPELDGNSLVTAALPRGLIDVILHGAALPSTETRPAPLRMPGFGVRLSDDEVATLATFLRGAWSNVAPAVTASEVADVRQQAVSQ